MSSNKGATKRERQRCFNIVEGHRQRVHMKWMNGPYHTGYSKEVYKRVVELLGRIEREILDIQEEDCAPETPHYQGDFSAEEMERALRVMEEQDQRNNPFEVST